MVFLLYSIVCTVEPQFLLNKYTYTQVYRNLTFVNSHQVKFNIILCGRLSCFFLMLLTKVKLFQVCDLCNQNGNNCTFVLIHTHAHTHKSGMQNKYNLVS